MAVRISCIEIQNFRKLKSTHIDFAHETTLFVGANNSGKTSAIREGLAWLEGQLEQKQSEMVTLEENRAVPSEEAGA